MAGVDTTVFDRVRSLRDFQDEYALNAAKIAKLQQEGADGGGHDPAAVKIVNEMQLAAQKANDPNANESDRAVAAHRYNLLNQVAKSYAIDRGMNAEVPDFYSAQRPGLPAGPAEAPQGGADPMADFTAALDQKSADGTLSPATGAIPRTAPPALPAAPAGGGVSEVKGFSDLAAGMAGQKKGAEADAANASDRAWKPGTAAAVAESTETGKGMGEAKNLYEDFMAAAPGLQAAGNKLFMLADASTYTLSGKARDAFMRQFDFDPGDSAANRAAAQNTIKVEVLPLLKATFGGAMTIEEGKWLLSTLGDDSLSPREKKAQIQARMDGWQREAERRARRTGAPAPAADMFSLDEQAAPAAAPKPGLQKEGVRKGVFDLKKQGFSEQDIMEYYKLKAGQ